MQLRIELADVSSEVDRLRARVDRVLERIGPKAQPVRDRVAAEMQRVEVAEPLSLAFVGQYSAGKSTLISALTGDRSIAVGADITTEATSFHEWEGLRLVDTPGLWTERTEHDARTLEALRQAGLIVFCVTCNLFDEVALHSFRDLAIVRQYAPKMFLVVGKMSAEHGPRDERIQQYRKSIDEVIGPLSMDTLPHAFVDARDYLDGVDDGDHGLVARSHMQELVQRLDGFVRTRGLFGALDAPVRVLQQAVSDAAPLVVRDANRDDTFMHLLSQIEHEVADVRVAMRAEVLEHRREGVRMIREAGMGLMSALITGQNIEAQVAAARDRVREATEQIARQVEHAITRYAERLQAAVDEILESASAARFAGTVARPAADVGDLERPAGGKDLEAWERLRGMASKAAARVHQAARGPQAGAAGGCS